MPFTKKKALLTLGSCVVVCVAAAGGFFLFQKFQQQQKRPVISLSSTEKTGKAAPMLKSRAATAVPLARPTMPVEQDKTGTQVRAALNNSETRLGDLARMRGQKHLLEQQVKIAELEQKLKEARNPVAPVAVVPAPEIVLPPLEPPKTEVKNKASSGPVVLSVQGVAGKLSATIRTSTGDVVTVEHGRRFGGGVLSVTRDSVLIRTGASTRAVPFKE